jgi:signal transduction histidine kinase
MKMPSVQARTSIDVVEILPVNDFSRLAVSFFVNDCFLSFFDEIETRCPLFSSVQHVFDRLSVSSKMLLVVGTALVVLAVPPIIYDVTAKHRQIEEMAERHAKAALDMLEAAHVQPMIHHGDPGSTAAAVETLDDSLEAFSEVNENVNLWLVMGPKVLTHQETNRRDVFRRPLDDIDRAVIETGLPKLVLNDADVLRVTRPVVLGQGSAGKERCVGCHSDLMNMAEGEVVGAYSAAVDLGVELAAWRRGIFEEVAVAAFVLVTTLVLIACLLRAAALRPLRQLTGVTRRLADGDTAVEIPCTNRVDELGMMAQSLDIFRKSLIEKHALEAEQVETLKLLETQKLRLETALDKERELSGMQRQFVTMVSHEFRTPLAIIDGNAQRIIKRKEQIAPERLHSGIDKIRSSVVRLVNLVESVLSVSQLDSDSVKFQPRSSDLRQIIKDVSANYRDMSPDHDLIIDVQGLPEKLRIDSNLMQQVISNLVSNAMKYSSIGARVWIDGSQADDGGVSVSVRDEGPGIPASELDKLFDRFFRGSASTGIIGTGIGLHLAKVFVELHGGRIDVLSAEGEGSTFTVHLPPPESMASGRDQAA